MSGTDLYALLLLAGEQHRGGVPAVRSERGERGAAVGVLRARRLRGEGRPTLCADGTAGAGVASHCCAGPG
eukprot:1409176-Rhodomonas_salina.8